jgi:cyclic beta-1,2-glucan synthetase
MTNLIKQFLTDFDNINEYYDLLTYKTKNHEYVGIINEWLIDNFYLLVEHKTNFLEDKAKLKKKLKDIDKIYVALKDIANRNNYNIDFKLLTKELNEYQKKNNISFTYPEIAAIKEVVLVIYTERLSNLCNDERKKLLNHEKVTNIINNRENKEITLNNFIDNTFDIKDDLNYIFEINNQLKEVGAKSNKLFKELNSLLEEKQLSIKEIVNDEYQMRIDNDMLIANIFNDLKEFFEFTEDDLYEKISHTEKLLLEDKIYKEMTEESKNLYRMQLLKLAKKKHMSELSYLEQLYKNEDSADYHIGFQLFKKKNNNIYVVLYITIITLVTLVVSFLLSKYFIRMRVIGFLILLIPVSQLFSKVLNEILIRIIPTVPLPKLDYTEGIPDSAKTMVVIPTIISNTDKIKEMFDNLETFYLINKTDNLYFTLLGDVKAMDKEVADYDEEISKYGVSYAKKLNDKYGDNLFHFVYRKRFWNEKENCFLGYERKRGALLQFNELLLHKMSKEDEHKYFNANTLSNFKEHIKYVITLDTDTKLVLNTALNLVGAMDHPMNRVVLNSSETKVIRGYGLMQPRVSVDIEATNRSLYSQIFAGIGGFDTYSATVPNLYQDAFQDGSYVGKGIYDLEAFDKILSNAIPDNLVLSHDLLEGSYMHCAYVSDVELIDDFPGNFLTDMTRHHRWARGDVQIIGWLKSKVHNKDNKLVNNPLNLLDKYKILDNIIRMFLFPTLLAVLILSLFFSKVNPLWWLGFVILEIAVPIIFFLNSKLYRKGPKKVTIYYKKLMFGGKSLLLRSYLVLATLPYYSKLYMDAFFRTLYRLNVSHKNLLNWITAEDAEKTIKKDLGNYLKNFSINIIFGFALLFLGAIFHNILAIIIALVFFSAPFILQYVSQDIDYEKINLNSEQVADLRELAYKTWLYFKDNLKEEYGYLIPDNYQENRDEKLDLRTSPTGIGFSLTSVVCASELEFITKEEALDLLDKILTSVDALEKWHGHLYNWYNLKTKRVMHPGFVSTIDSGNLIASIIIVREYLDKLEETRLVKLCDKLIKQANFKKLYTKKEVFSIGYDEIEGKLSGYNYNKFASESRLTSYLAIALGDVAYKHWFCLDKSLTTYKGRKGLISWSGTAFEYYMPLLYMKNYPNTLLDESYHFARFCQKDYINSVSFALPWGISESAYNELDNALNYKYKAFSTPYLKAKEDKENRIVLSPYSSLMVMEMFPEDVYQNILKFKHLNMSGKYGLYEAYDYDNRGVVRAFFAHHEGMSLMGITNYLKADALKDYFHDYVNIKTFNILLKEKVQVKTNIDMKMARYKKYNYNKEAIENDIRAFNYISYMPEVSVLSNKKYCLLMNDRGDSFSRYRTLQLNRYRKVTEQDYGIFLYIKDLDNNKIWSNTYAPMNKKPDKYEVVFAADKIKFLRHDYDITTKTEITVAKDHNAEIRKITFKNESDEVKNLELTTYTEVILSEQMDDVSHRVFNSMFIASEYDDATNSLIMRHNSRADNNVNSYMVNRLVIDDPKDKYSYETERANFIGRNNTTSNPMGLNKELTCQDGTNLDPIISLRNKIEIEANSSTTVYLINGFGRSREQIMDIVKAYSNEEQIEKAFRVATLMNIINTKNMNITGADMRTFNMMLNYLYQTTRISVNEERMDLLRKNALGQAGLWKFGVSGDRPIILVEISDISDLSFVFEILKCFEYYKNNSIFVDIIIINNEASQYAKIIKKEIDDEMYRMYTLNSFYHTPGSITVISSANITREEKSLLYMVPRLKFIINNHESLKESVANLQKANSETISEKVEYEDNIKKKYPGKLVFDNGFGGFRDNGREYVIYNKNTPKPWVNVMANNNFGTIVTNNGCGFTYAYNSGEFKLTSWTNDMVCNDKSEGFKFNGKMFDPELCVHGFGYTIFEAETKETKKEITEFVASQDTVKLYLMKLTNKLDKAQDLEITYWINPVFGNFEEKTARHILTEFLGLDNYLKMRNVYSINYGDVVVFMGSSELIDRATIDKILVKDITIKVHLDPKEEKELVFSLGSGSADTNLSLVKKYSNILNVKKELKLIKEGWLKDLSVMHVESPDNSFNYMVNGWYLYQTMSSRILAKAGFYQVSGAFGYRDQLQDAMNIAAVKPDFARNQILINAKHQFMEGDVLHWWHEKNHFGLRSRYKDDYLWLVYAVCQYIDATNDMEILKEKVPYVIGDTLSDYEKEKGLMFNYSSLEETILEHCLKSLHLAMNSLGPHKLPLMGGGDWNDGMNKVGIKGKGESVWLGFFLYDVLNRFVKLLGDYDKKLKVDDLVEFKEKLKDNINKKAWDGNYYLRAYFDNGDKLGSHENSECKIDLISQSCAILSGVIPKDRITEVINAVEDNLIDNNTKIIKLLTPAFEKSLDNPGYIMNYPVGIRENGGQYTHSVSWYLMALEKVGYFDRAYKYYQMINPINRTKTKEDVLKYQVEPYVVVADIYSAPKYLGHGGWTWYTGTAGWFYNIAIYEILGMIKQGDVLTIKPNMPVAWDNFKLTYRYIDTIYKINVKKSNENKIKLDGKEIVNNKILLVNDQVIHQIDVSTK